MVDLGSQQSNLGVLINDLGLGVGSLIKILLITNWNFNFKLILLLDSP